MKKQRHHAPQPFNPVAAAFNNENAALYIAQPASSLKISRRTGLLT